MSRDFEVTFSRIPPEAPIKSKMIYASNAGDIRLRISRNAAVFSTPIQGEDQKELIENFNAWKQKC